jgi:hypothetical protein
MPLYHKVNLAEVSIAAMPIGSISAVKHCEVWAKPEPADRQGRQGSLAGGRLPGVLKKNTGKTLIGSFADVGVKKAPPKFRRRIWVEPS